MSNDASLTDARQDTEQALFIREGEWFLPTAYTTGPWRPDAMNGGPPCSLLGLAIHDAIQDGEYAARVNVDLERPVPLEPLQTRLTRRDVSRRVSHVEATLSTERGVVASARAMILRGQGVRSRQDLDPVLEQEIPSPDSAPANFEDQPWSHLVFHKDGMELRYTQGAWHVPGAKTVWMRLSVPLVAGEETNALSQLLALADFGSPFSQTFPPEDGVGMINVDLCLTLAGNPVGPWFRMESGTSARHDGMGMASTQLSDTRGFLAVSTLSQLANPMPKA